MSVSITKGRSSNSCVPFWLIISLLAVPIPSSLTHAQDHQRREWWFRSPNSRTKYYSLKTDLPREQAKELAQHMDATCESYITTFSKLPVRMRRPAQLGLLLFADEKDYLQTLSARFGVDGTGSWGMCIARGKTISLVGFRESHTIEQMKPLLQHEGFHQFAQHLFADIPTWADEGLAEVFERGVVVGDELVLGEIPRRDKERLVNAIESQQTIPLVQLLNMDPRQWSHRVKAEEATMQYLQAWSVVNFLLFADDGRYQKSFLTFLVQLNADADWERAFVAAFGWPNLALMEQQWIDYVKAAPATDFRETVRRLDFLAAGMLHLREQKVYPASFSELKAELSKTDFTHSISLYGKERVYVARDEGIYSLPGTTRNSETGFRLTDRQGRPPRKNYKSARSPIPLNITTTQLTPQNLSIKWAKRRNRFTHTVTAVPGS